ncbi:MAG: twin-arginine translocase TatA/TatE family subunit [Candidatus Kapabacteria bacterium]|nr:twin-arginine translocase TatA/TatE family subunit [Candidatus Kapabacteria bacterium]
MFDVGGGELVLIFLVILLLFGPKKIPEFAQQVGRGIRQFRKAQEDLTQQIRDISADVAVRDATNVASAKPPVVISPPDDSVSRGASEPSVAEPVEPLDTDTP